MDTPWSIYRDFTVSNYVLKLEFTCSEIRTKRFRKYKYQNQNLLARILKIFKFTKWPSNVVNSYYSTMHVFNLIYMLLT